LRQAAPAALAAAASIDHAQLAKIAVERMRLPVVVSDPRLPDNPIVFANQAFLDQTGYTAAEVIGRNCRFLQGPATDPAALAEIRAAIAAEEDVTIELLNYRRDGSTFWNRLMLSPITDDDGRLLYYFASQLDVTEERRARDLAAREHILLREIDHRAKNALALVQGIVRLTRADDAHAYSCSVQGRVEALARAHIVLSDAEWRGVPLDRVVTVAVAPFGPQRTTHGGPAVEIAAAHVQPLILAFHELLANAAQHGGLSTSDGAVTLRWHTDGDSVVIELSERGGPPPDEPAKPGYGLTMIDAFVRRQLRGSVERRWHRRGLNTRVAFPLRPAACAPG
jgi:PAS domain S-box-containing protein